MTAAAKPTDPLYAAQVNALAIYDSAEACDEGHRACAVVVHGPCSMPSHHELVALPDDLREKIEADAEVWVEERVL